MLVVLLPAALLFALSRSNPMAVQSWIGVVLIAFGIFKLFRPRIRASWRGSGPTGRFAIVAFAVPAAMATALLLTSSAVAVLVYRRLGLAALTRYRINLDLGWAVVFILMGAMAFMM